MTARGPRDALITGMGLISSLGDGAEAHWAAFDAIGSGRARPIVDTASFSPWPVHPMVVLDLDKQIPRKGDQRQMEPWQRFGTYAAGLALDAAGLKGDAETLARTDLIVAAGGGERDFAVDGAILDDMAGANDPDSLLNARLMTDLRPTLFLAQLSNLLAGNISIVHGVVGSSRTFMGEEAAGADAVRIACARIAAGQGEVALVGGSYHAQRPDVFLQYELTHLLLRDRPFSGVWSRQAGGGGMVTGSLSCFLVIESRQHAEHRGAKPVARIAHVSTMRCARQPGQATANLRAQLATVKTDDATAILSGAAGIADSTAEEKAALDATGLPYRATATAYGHTFEPSFPASLAMAAMAVSRGELFGPLDDGEKPLKGGIERALVTSWGHWRGEALGVVDRA